MIKPYVNEELIEIILVENNFEVTLDKLIIRNMDESLVLKLHNYMQIF